MGNVASDTLAARAIGLQSAACAG